MKEYGKDSNLTRAAMRADMDRKTARKFVKTGLLPSQLKPSRGWRTHEDVFSEVWDDIAERLKDAPELEAKALFENVLLFDFETKFNDSHLRTFQRRVKQWRATYGPNKNVFFAQEHRPGEAMQTDFTCANELNVTIDGELYEHLLCNVVLPYSNWQWVTISKSESMLALKHGLQEAVFRLGKVPAWHQTDNSTAATHTLKHGKKERGFNEEYLALMKHLKMNPRTIETGQSNQNGDVEALNGSLKRRLKQHLLLRGHRNFESRATYQEWLYMVIHQANKLRLKKLSEELLKMKDLTVERLPEFKDLDVKVTSWSTIRVKNNTYSVPSRLIQERVKARVYEHHIEVWYGQSLQLTLERLVGKSGRNIDYRHVIWSLVRKPGAFERYKYRAAMFPTLVFRRAYDVLLESTPNQPRKADIAYLRILHLAASTNESEVEMALELLLEAKALRGADDVKALVQLEDPLQIPNIAVPIVDLKTYDQLLCEVAQ